MADLTIITEFIKANLRDIGITAGIALVALVIGKFVYAILKKFLERLTKKTKTDIDDKILAATERSIYAILFFTGLKIGLDFTGILKAHAEILGKLFSIVWIVIGTFLAIETTTILISVYGKKRLGIGTSYLIQRLTKIGILFVSLIFVLNSLGIEISPLLASLGIAGIAVAFALQDTLANFFSGLYLTADQPIRPGDYIKVDENISGTVLEIGWRSTRLRTYDNNILIIPNKRLGESIITNYNLPGSKILMSTSIDSSYNDNPEKVEKIIYKTAKKVRDKLSTCVKGYEPVVRFYDFGSSGLKFKVFLEVKRIGDQFEVGHILRKELYNAFKKNKIEIPFTTQSVYLKKTK